MPSYVPAKRATAFIFYAGLPSQASPGTFRTNPTIAAGDFKVSIDGGALANLTTLPTVTPASSKMVKFSLSSAEMTGDNITVVCSDAAGAEWFDVIMNIQTAARQIDDLAYPATSGRSMVVDANGLVDANTVKVGPSGSGTAQTAKDIGGAVPAVAAGASGGLLISGSNSGTTTLGALTVTGTATISNGLVVNSSTANTNAVAFTGNGTGSGLVITSGSGATGDGVKMVAASTNGNGLTLTKTGTGKDLNATSTPLTLAKTTNITGLNDIAATDIVSSGAITTSGGAVSTVTNLTNAPTAGDFTATMKTSLNAATPSVTVSDKTGFSLSSAGIQAIWDALTSALTTVGSIGKLLTTNIDAATSSRMATYTQPTGFLAATFPGTVASTTNITAGTITTVTNLTNAPTSGDFTATMKTSLNAATPSVTVSDKTGFSLSSAGIQAIWDALTSALTTVGSIGKRIADNLDATVSSRLATSGYTAPDNTSITAIKAKTDNLTFTVAGQVDANAESMNGTTINGTGTAGDLWRGA